MKRKILLLAAVIACVAVTAAGTLAYFNAEGTAHNVITTGGVKIEVIEQMQDGDTLIDFPEEGISGVMPGSSVSKIVQVKNTGESEAWIRVKVSGSIQNTQGEELSVEVMSFTVMDGWMDGGDGYYYYHEPVASNALTDVLLQEVLFSPSMGNEYQNCTANIVIHAQAVQAANNAIPAGGDVTDIIGWPTE